VIFNWLSHQLVCLATCEVATINIARLTLNLAILKLGITKSCKDILPEPSLRYVACIKPTVSTWSLTHFIAKLLGFLCNIWLSPKLSTWLISGTTAKFLLKFRHVLSIVKPILLHYLRLPILLLLLLLLLIVIRLLRLYRLLLILFNVWIMWFQSRAGGVCR